MKDFNDLGVSPTIKSFVGDKISIDRILNEPIIIEAFKIELSKYPKDGNEKRVDLQIKKGDYQYVVFTSGVFLMDVLLKLPADAFPFKAKIVRINKHFEFRSAKE